MSYARWGEPSPAAAPGGEAAGPGRRLAGQLLDAVACAARRGGRFWPHRPGHPQGGAPTPTARQIGDDYLKALARSAAGPAVAGALLATYQLAPLPLALLASAVFLAWAWLRPADGLVAVVLALPYNQSPRPVFGNWSFSAAEVGILLCAAAAGLALLLPVPAGPLSRVASRRPRRLPRLASFDRGALAFALLAAASQAVAVQPWISLRALRTVVLEPVAFYFLAVWLGGGRAGLLRLAGAVVASAAIVSLIGLWQYATNQNIITAEESLRRIRGFYGSPNNLGLYLGRALPLACCLWLFGGKGRRIYGLALAPLAAALLLTFSAGAWLGVLAALLFVASLRGRRAFTAGIAGVAALTAASVPFLLGLARFRSHFDLGEGTTFLRLQVWQSALAMLRDHPLLGIGLDSFLYYYRDLKYMLPAAWREPSLSHPHNLVLDFWLSLGLAGLVLAVALLVRFFRAAIALYRTERDPWTRALALGVAASMVDFLAHGLIDNSYFLPDLAVLFWLAFAIVRVLRATASREEPAEAGT